MSQPGIQALLQAEDKARAIVAAARAERVALLKRAEDEAAKEVAEYRAQRERQYQESIGKNKGNKGEYSQRLDDETNQTIKQMRDQSQGNASKVVELLLTSVMDTTVD